METRTSNRHLCDVSELTHPTKMWLTISSCGPEQAVFPPNKNVKLNRLPKLLLSSVFLKLVDAFGRHAWI